MKTKLCAICDKEFSYSGRGFAKKVTCSDKCSRTLSRLRKLKQNFSGMLPLRVCMRCQKKLLPDSGMQKYCTICQPVVRLIHRYQYEVKRGKEAHWPFNRCAICGGFKPSNRKLFCYFCSKEKYKKQRLAYSRKHKLKRKAKNDSFKSISKLYSLVELTKTINQTQNNDDSNRDSRRT